MWDESCVDEMGARVKIYTFYLMCLDDAPLADFATWLVKQGNTNRIAKCMSCNEKKLIYKCLSSETKRRKTWVILNIAYHMLNFHNLRVRLSLLLSALKMILVRLRHDRASRQFCKSWKVGKIERNVGKINVVNTYCKTIQDIKLLSCLTYIGLENTSNVLGVGLLILGDFRDKNDYYCAFDIRTCAIWAWIIAHSIKTQISFCALVYFIAANISVIYQLKCS